MEQTKKSLIKKISNVVLTVVLVLIVAVVGLSIYSQKTGKDILSYKIMYVLTPSMEDTIPMQSYILTKKTDAKSVKKGDIITFKFDVDGDGVKNELNTHRIVEVIGNNEQFITKGDNNLVVDSPILASDVVAKYVCNLTVLSFFAKIYATPFGFVLTLIVIMAVFLFSTYFKRDKKEEPETDEDKKNEIDKLVAEEIARLEKLDKECKNGNE